MQIKFLQEDKESSHTVGQYFLRCVPGWLQNSVFTIERWGGSVAPQRSGKSGLGRVRGVLGKMRDAPLFCWLPS